MAERKNPTDVGSSAHAIGNGNGNGNGEETKERILSCLREHTEGLTAIEIAEIVKSHRQTVTKYLLVLEATGLILRRRLGSATVHYLKESLDHRVRELEILELIRKRL